MYLSDQVTVGFANSKGVVTKNIMEEKYQVVERMNLKPTIVRPRIRPKHIPEYDLGTLKQLVNRRRNQTVLKSFVGVDQEAQRVAAVHEIEEECGKMIRNIDEEMSMLVALKKDVTMGHFVRETGATEVEAAEYMTEFNNDAPQAIRAYKQRMELVKSFSQKNGMGMFQAHEILKANQYNAALFE